MNLNQVTLPATDVELSSAFYRNMGFTQIVRSHPRYARFECPEGDATFSLHFVETPAVASGVVIYFECSNLDERVAQLLGNGFEFTQLPTNESWLWREARLKDPSGNEICLFWAGENRRHPPWRVAA